MVDTALENKDDESDEDENDEGGAEEVFEEDSENVIDQETQEIQAGKSQDVADELFDNITNDIDINTKKAKPSKNRPKSITSTVTKQPKWHQGKEKKYHTCFHCHNLMNWQWPSEVA